MEILNVRDDIHAVIGISGLFMDWDDNIFARIPSPIDPNPFHLIFGHTCTKASSSLHASGPKIDQHIHTYVYTSSVGSAKSTISGTC